MFREVGSNCFVITFANLVDKIKVLVCLGAGCPWLFDNHLFVFK